MTGWMARKGVSDYGNHDKQIIRCEIPSSILMPCLFKSRVWDIRLLITSDNIPLLQGKYCAIFIIQTI